jgi:hypothetical protein
MKRNGRSRNGVEAKRRRARIARRLRLAALRVNLPRLAAFEAESFARDYRPILSPDLVAELSAAFAE